MAFLGTFINTIIILLNISYLGPVTLLYKNDGCAFRRALVYLLFSISLLSVRETIGIVSIGGLIQNIGEVLNEVKEKSDNNCPRRR